MIIFLHTSSTHIKRFTDIVRKYDSVIKIKHFVKEELLEAASKTGKIDKEGFTRSIQFIRKELPDLIICTCSTYGEACEDLADVKRIDQPIAAYIVEHFSRIILAYTAISTWNVSRKLLENTARAKNKEIEIIDGDCTASWQYFLSNDMENYHKEIFGKVSKIYTKGQAIFLAQASMEGAKKYFDDEVEIFSSGEFGVMKYLEEISN